MNCMLHDDPVFDSFLHDAYSSYGDKGLYEAKKVVKKYEATPHEPEDAGFIKEAFIQTFWDAMAYKQKHQ